MPGVTPTDPVRTVVCSPLKETAVPARAAKFLQLPSGIVVPEAEYDIAAFL